MFNTNNDPAKVLTKLIQFKIENYYPPTIRQLADYCEINPSAVRDDLNHLEHTGHIQRDPDASRSIRILKLNYDPPA